jgi:hypothetical protein
MYTIKLNNGTIISNLVLNGNNFISDKIISDDIFTNNLDKVEISDGKSTQIYQDMMLVANRVIDGKSWFILAEKTQEQKEKEELEKCINDIYATLVSKGLKTINDLPNELQSKVSKLIVQQDSIQKR